MYKLKSLRRCRRLIIRSAFDKLIPERRSAEYIACTNGFCYFKNIKLRSCRCKVHLLNTVSAEDHLVISSRCKIICIVRVFLRKIALYFNSSRSKAIVIAVHIPDNIAVHKYVIGSVVHIYSTHAVRIRRSEIEIAQYQKLALIYI